MPAESNLIEAISEKVIAAWEDRYKFHYARAKDFEYEFRNLKQLIQALDREFIVLNRNEQNLRDNCVMQNFFNSEISKYVKLTQYTELREYLSSNYTRDELRRKFQECRDHTNDVNKMVL